MDELTDDDGVLDGFSGRDELMQVIRAIYEPVYGSVAPDHWVSVYALIRP